MPVHVSTFAVCFKGKLWLLPYKRVGKAKVMCAAKSA